MTVHILLLVYITLCACIVYRHNQYTFRHNELYICLSFLGIWLVEALRGSSVGSDTYSYSKVFTQLQHSGIARRWERLFYFIIWIVRRFTSNPQWMLAVISAFILIGFGIFILFNTEPGNSCFWAVFFFVTLTHYFNSMNLLRQYCAMAVAINIYTVLKAGTNRRRFFIAGLLLLAAFFIHSSSIICIGFFIPFMERRTDRKSIFLVAVVSVLSILLFSRLLDIAFALFPRYSIYQNSKYLEESTVGMYYFVLIILKIFVIALVFSLDPKHEENKDLYRFALLIMISIGILSLKSQMALAVRINYYYDIYIILLLPELIRRFRCGFDRDIVRLVTALFCVAMFFYMMQGSGRGCVPYAFFWN